MSMLCLDGWVQLVDDNTGRAYFHNTLTGRSQWEHPNETRPFKDLRLAFRDLTPAETHVLNQSFESSGTIDNNNPHSIAVGEERDRSPPPGTNKNSLLSIDDVAEDLTPDKGEESLFSSLGKSSNITIPVSNTSPTAPDGIPTSTHTVPPVVEPGATTQQQQPNQLFMRRNSISWNAPLETVKETATRPVVAHRRSQTSGSGMLLHHNAATNAGLGATTTAGRRTSVTGYHRRSLTGNFSLNGTFGEREVLENMVSTMKDRRCWGRPDRARTHSDEGTYPVPEIDSDSQFRFRTTSSADPFVLARLSGMTDPVTKAKQPTLPTVPQSPTATPRALGAATVRQQEIRRARSNTTSTMFVTSTMSSPDGDNQMWCVSAVIHAHMVVFQGKGGQLKDDPRYTVFLDQDTHGNVVHNANIPSTQEIFNFIKRVHSKAQMENECIIMSLVYLERLLKATKEKLPIKASNWQSIVLSALILASKVWDDLSMWNADFSLICPSFTLKRINELEVALLEAMKFNVRVSASTYAKYYFQLRSMRGQIGLGVGEEVASPLDMNGAKRLETVSQQYTDSLMEETEMEIRRRSNTLFGGASHETIQDMHQRGYRYTSGAATKAATFEQLVSMVPGPPMNDFF